MNPTDSSSFPAGSLSFDGCAYAIVDLPALFGDALRRLPLVLRLLLENVVRNMQGAEREAAVAALLAWLDSGTSDAEIAFQPGRVLMHDTTSTPALVDIAAMRDALAEAGVDPVGAQPGAAGRRVDRPLAGRRGVRAARRAGDQPAARDARATPSATASCAGPRSALDGVRINPPGTGIMHTINLEQLATVVTDRGARRRAVGGARHDDRHRQPHADDQRHRRARLGRRRARGADGDVRHADDAAHPRRGRRPADRRAAPRRAGDRPGADGDAAAARHRRVGRVRRVLRPGRGRPDRRRALRGRQHGARVRRHHRLLSGRCAARSRYLEGTGRGRKAIGLVEAYCRRTGLWFEPDAEPRYTRIDRDRPRRRRACTSPGRSGRRTCSTSPTPAPRWLRSISAPRCRTPRCRAIRSPSPPSPAAPTPPTRRC